MMNECRDRRFERMLHAYELGLLDDIQRRELELHLMECEACLENVKQFNPTAQLINRDPDLRKAIEEIAEEQTARATGPDQFVSVKRRWLPKLVPTFAIAVILFILLLVKPWHVEIKMDEEALAAENRVAVMHFENLGDPADGQRLGEIITNLLITDLSESHYMQVISGQRIYDLLKLMGKSDSKKIDKDIAFKVATRARARWLLMGSILQVEPEVVITSQLIEVATGNSVATQKITASRDENIFSMVDKLSAEIKEDLILPKAARREPEIKVADVTTHSEKAYFYYLEGRDYCEKYYFIEAKQSFRKALEYDSTFAMAYYELSLFEVPGALENALKYIDKVSEREKYWIRYAKATAAGDGNLGVELLKELLKRYPDERNAYYIIGLGYHTQKKYDQSIQLFNKALELDSLYKPAYNLLAYGYSLSGDFEKALAAINQYIAIAPDEANPYDSRGDICVQYGKIDEAIESYEKALRIKPDYPESLYKLGALYFFKDEYARAESCFQVIAGMSDESRAGNGRLYLASVPMYQGKYGQAHRILDDAIAADRIANGAEKYFLNRYVKAMIYEEQGNLSAALKEAGTAISIFSAGIQQNDHHLCAYYVQLLAESGDTASAWAKCREYKDYVEKRKVDSSWYICSRGVIELASGNLQAAINELSGLKVEWPSDYFNLGYMLGIAYMKAGYRDKAIKQFEDCLGRLDVNRIVWGIRAVKAYYYLGILYEESGENEMAINMYKEFLSILQNADPGIKEVDDARVRLDRLTKKS